MAKELLTVKEQTEEYLRCLIDTKYFAEKYCKVWDKKNAKYIPFKIMPHQERVLEAYENNNEVLVSKYRQAGITTISTLHIAKKIVFGEGFKIAIVANKLKLAKEEIFLNVIKILENLPDFLRPIPTGKDSSDHKIYSNGCEIKALAAGKNGVRGFSPDLLFLDEAAYFEYGELFWTSAKGALSAGGEIIIVSTPNGLDYLYNGTYQMAMDKKNTFKVVEIAWYEDIRFNTDLEWFKDNKLVVTGEEARNKDKFKEYVIKGYKPSSSWFIEQCQGYQWNKKKIAAELENSFIGSGGALIDSEIIARHEQYAKETKVMEDPYDDRILIFEPPLPNEEYILSADISSGFGEDFTAFIVAKHDKLNGILLQVAEFHGKDQSEKVAKVIYDYGKMYNNAYVVVDITGSHGIPVMERLLEMGYKNLHFTEISNRAVSDRTTEMARYDGKRPGFIIGNAQVRNYVIESLEEMLRLDQFITRSFRATAEYKTFIQLANGRYDHQKGKHDDILMSIAMACYVVKISFRANSSDRAMLEAMTKSWTVRTSQDVIDEYENTYIERFRKKEFKHDKEKFDEGFYFI